MVDLAIVVWNKCTSDMWIDCMVVYSSHIYFLLIHKLAPILANSYLVGNLVTLDDVVLVQVAVHINLRV